MAQRDWNPDWWNESEASAWDRVKEALRRDWEQTKHDFSSKHGQELNQDVDDTVKQAAGKQPIPPAGDPNADDESFTRGPTTASVGAGSSWAAMGAEAWERREPAMRYGYGAAGHYQGREWDTSLESELRTEWSGFKSNLPWDRVKDEIRRGWDARRRSTRRP